MPENNTNLPILDDIIKPGNADKAVHQPSSKVQSSLMSDDAINAPPSTRIDAKTTPISASDDQPDTVELYTNDQSAAGVTVRKQATPATDVQRTVGVPKQQGVLADAEQAQPPAIDLPDFAAVTEEILADLMIEMEQLLRDKIQQSLRKRFPDETWPD